MRPETAIKLLKSLGAKDIKYDGGQWVKSPCILAPWTHKGGKDSNPSFGIRVKNMKPHYHCFTCRAGSLQTLIQEVEMFLGKGSALSGHYDTKLARAILENEEFDIEPLPEFSEFGDASQQFQEWPTYFIESFASWEFNARAFKYLQQRGVSPETAQKFGLRYDSKKDMIVCPYSNLYGKLAGARGRAVELEGEPKRKGRHYDYTWNQVNNAHLVWYNEQVIAEEQPIVVVEGQFDAMRVSEVYPYVVANMTAKPVPEKVKKLAYAPAVVLMMDNDETGDIAVEKYVSQLSAMNKPIAIVQPPKEYDAEGKLIKQDPDAMGAEWIRAQLKDLDLL